MRLEACLNDENIGPQGYSHANLTITSVICYVASVVVPDSVMVTRLTSIQGDVGSNPARGKLPIFSEEYVGKIKTCFTLL